MEVSGAGTRTCQYASGCDKQDFSSVRATQIDIIERRDLKVPTRHGIKCRRVNKEWAGPEMNSIFNDLPVSYQNIAEHSKCEFWNANEFGNFLFPTIRLVPVYIRGQRDQKNQITYYLSFIL